MIRYEYRLERVPMRNTGRPVDSLNELGSKGFEAIQAVLQNNDLVVLLMKETEAAAPAKKKEEPKKPASKKDQQEIKDVVPTTKHVKEVMDELIAEE